MVTDQQDARRTAVILGVLLFALLFIANGTYIIVKGRIGPRFRRPSEPEKVLSYPQRIATAALYFLVGIALMFLVFTQGGS